MPVHAYDIRQLTIGFYAMNTSTVLPDIHISSAYACSARASRRRTCTTRGPIRSHACHFATTRGRALDTAGVAVGCGCRHRTPPAPNLAVFGRAARAFRLGNADERVGAGSQFVFVPPNFDLKTQTSHDVQAGVRFQGGLNVESSVYLRRLTNEIHFVPALGIDTNLDLTKRVGLGDERVLSIPTTAFA
jgi:iron complex outermembrane receptor protein